VKLSILSTFDVKYHFRQNRGYYISFIVSFFVGLIIGIVVLFTTESYLNLLTTENKILFTYINGTANSFGIFSEKLLVFILPILLIFLLGLYYYTSLLSYVFLTYQTVLFVMSCGSLIRVYGLSGLLNVLLVTIPINLLYFVALVFFSVTCISRSKLALQNKRFSEGFDDVYFIKVIMTILYILIICFYATVVLPLFLKNANFVIF